VRISCCDRESEVLEDQSLLLHRDVAVGIGGRAADECDIDWECLVEKIFLPVDGHDLDDVLHRQLVHLSALDPWIHERAKAYSRQRPGLACRDVAVEMRDNALGQVVCLDLVLLDQLADLGRKSEVAADYTF
jgi:hypothetical protein